MIIFTPVSLSACVCVISENLVLAKYWTHRFRGNETASEIPVRIIKVTNISQAKIRLSSEYILLYINGENCRLCVKTKELLSLLLPSLIVQVSNHVVLTINDTICLDTCTFVLKSIIFIFQCVVMR